MMIVLLQKWAEIAPSYLYFCWNCVDCAEIVLTSHASFKFYIGFYVTYEASPILLMEEILHQLIGSLSHYLQGFYSFIHPRWVFSPDFWTIKKTTIKLLIPILIRTTKFLASTTPLSWVVEWWKNSRINKATWATKKKSCYFPLYCLIGDPYNGLL